MVEKKPPFPTPFITAKNNNGASVVDIGQMASMLIAFRNKQKHRVLRAPILSQRNPQRTLPMAEEKLNPAKRPAPVTNDRPIDQLNMGRKNGGTRSAKVAMAPARNIRRNLASVNKVLLHVCQHYKS